MEVANGGSSRRKFLGHKGKSNSVLSVNFRDKTKEPTSEDTEIDGNKHVQISLASALHTASATDFSRHE
jgi:hypothetical protein